MLGINTQLYPLSRILRKKKEMNLFKPLTVRKKKEIFISSTLNPIIKNKNFFQVKSPRNVEFTMFDIQELLRADLADQGVSSQIHQALDATADPTHVTNDWDTKKWQLVAPKSVRDRNQHEYVQTIFPARGTNGPHDNTESTSARLCSSLVTTAASSAVKWRASVL